MPFYSAATPGELATLFGAWPDAETLEPPVLAMLLDVAAEQVLAFGPELEEDAEIPARFVFAQLRQAQTLWAAGIAQGDGDIGTASYSFTPRPLDKTIRNIIRPAKGAPRGF